ncbi:MAG: ATP synthase subunit I [Spirochaetota bacterium]
MSLDPGGLLLGVIAGLAAGALYFGGLYTTTRRFATSRRPGLLMALSFVGRTLAIVGTAILVATSLGAAPLLAFAVGLTIARIVLVTRVRRGAGAADATARRSSP